MSGQRDIDERAAVLAELDDALLRFVHLFGVPEVRAFVREALPPDMDMRHHRLLRAIEDLGAPTMSELAERLDLDVSTVSRNVDRAGEAGYVVRERSKEDGRRRVLVLTPEGREALAVGTRVRRDLWATLATKVAETDLRRTASVLRAFRSAAEDLGARDQD